MIARWEWIAPKLLRWGPVAAYVLLIFGVSSMSSPPAVASAPNLDKAAHLVEYGVLGLMLGWALGLPRTGGRAWGVFFLAVAVGAAIGLGDELYQGTVPGRESSYWDLLADMVGLTAALAALLWWGKRRRGAGLSHK
jgi:VanZ family protein